MAYIRDGLTLVLLLAALYVWTVLGAGLVGPV